MFLPRLLWISEVSFGFWLLRWCRFPVAGLRTPLGHTFRTEVSCYRFFSHLFLCHYWCHHHFFATEVHDLNDILIPTATLLVALFSPWPVVPGVYLQLPQLPSHGKRHLLSHSLLRQSNCWGLPQLLLCSLLPAYVPPTQRPPGIGSWQCCGFLPCLPFLSHYICLWVSLLPFPKSLWVLFSCHHGSFMFLYIIGSKRALNGLVWGSGAAQS